MVSASRCCLLLAGLAICFVGSLSATESPAYQIGDTLRADIVAPGPLTVVNSNATAALKQKEAMKVTAIFVHNPKAADEVERDFRAAFVTVRSNFFDAMGAVYQRKKLNPQWLGSTRFTTLSSTFKQQNPNFPQLPDLIEIWATGKSDDAIQDALAARLREAMQRRIRADASPEIKLGGHVRVISITNDTTTLTADGLKKIAVTIPRTNLMTLNRVRSEFQQLAPREVRPEARFLASFLKPNCVLDVELTSLMRERHVKALYVADQYKAGDVIARNGQKVDAKIMAILSQLKPLQPQPIEAKIPQASDIPWQYRMNPWLWAGLVLCAGGVVVGAWRLLNRPKRVTLLPARVAGEGGPAGIITCPSCDENIIVPTDAVENLSANAASWQQRALAAEKRAGRAQEAIRAGVLPHFAQWLKQKFVRGLIADRQQLLEAQKSAALELAELERRLDDLHAPLQERLRAYEKRIAELETLLVAKGEENRELLRAKIEITRQQLKNARARNPLEFN